MKERERNGSELIGCDGGFCVCCVNNRKKPGKSGSAPFSFRGFAGGGVKSNGIFYVLNRGKPFI
jgi:hypothetical protein